MHNGSKHSSRPPVLPTVGIIALVPDEWEKSWESRHHILSRLGKYFNVVWVNPASEWREIQLLSFSKNQGCRSLPECAGRLVVYKPEKFLPKFYRPQFLASFTERMRLQRAHRMLYDLGSRRIIVYLWRPSFGPALDLIQHDVSCYHMSGHRPLRMYSHRRLVLLHRSRSVAVELDSMIGTFLFTRSAAHFVRDLGPLIFGVLRGLGKPLGKSCVDNPPVSKLPSIGMKPFCHLDE